MLVSVHNTPTAMATVKLPPRMEYFSLCNCDIDDVQFGYASGREHTFIIHAIVATYLPYMTDD
jgi:hypothetical protein